MKRIIEPREYTFGISNIEQHCVEEVGRIFDDNKRQQEMLFWWRANRFELLERQKTSAEELKRFQLKRLSFIVDYAFSNTKFYKTLYSKVGYKLGEIRSFDDFEKLPVISKDDLIHAYPHEILPTGIKSEHCYGLRTSGSSGKPVTIVLNDDRARLDTAERLRQFETMMDTLFLPSDWVYNIHHCPWWFTSMAGELPTFTLNQEASVEAFEEHVAALRPKFVSGLPSYLLRAAKKGVRLASYGVCGVSTNSEGSSKAERQFMSQVFGLPVLDEYSSEELGLIASECTSGHYHFVDDGIFAEVFGLDSEGIGNMVGTDLWNLAMPIIRYNQGDLISLPTQEKDRCGCGSSFSFCDRVFGRSDQALVRANGIRVSPGTLLELCDQFLASENSGISEFRVEQTSIVEVVLWLKRSPDLNLNLATIQLFEDRLLEILGESILVRKEVVDEIPKSKSYKRRTIISNVK